MLRMPLSTPFRKYGNVFGHAAPWQSRLGERLAHGAATVKEWSASGQEYVGELLKRRTYLSKLKHAPPESGPWVGHALWLALLAQENGQDATGP